MYLVFPPLWYYTSVPADLSHTAAVVRADGIDVRCLDLSARLTRDIFSDTAAWPVMRDAQAYGDPATRAPLMAALDARSRQVSGRLKLRYRPRMLRFGDFDEADTFRGRKTGISNRNPALNTLKAVAAEIVRDAPEVVAIALVYPEQRVQVLGLARILRVAGYRGVIVLYGSLQDEIAPEDFVPDLIGAPKHNLFEDIDGVIAGEAGTALVRLYRWVRGQGRAEDIPNLLWARDRIPGRAPKRVFEELSTYPVPDFSWVEPEIYCTPAPVVDLRMGRGCPWGKCAFCAIPGAPPGLSGGTGPAGGRGHGSGPCPARHRLVPDPRRPGDPEAAARAVQRHPCAALRRPLVGSGAVPVRLGPRSCCARPARPDSTRCGSGWSRPRSASGSGW